jgi:hypothetical protein
VGESVRQIAIIGEQHQSGRVHIQPAYRIETRQGTPLEVPDSRASLGIFERAHYPAWFMQENVTGNVEANRPAIHLDPILINPDPTAQLTHHGAVDPDTP